ncbi:MAG: class I SAM-dependent methyltransferase [Cyanobacteria bacterium J06627_15]
MSMDTQAEYVTALTELHRGLDRKGPGDADFSRKILSSLPTLPLKPRMADLGCGSGAGALLLAQHYESTVRAVDSSSVFIDELKARAKVVGLEHLIIPKQIDRTRWPMKFSHVTMHWDN